LGIELQVPNRNKKGCVTHCGLAIYIKKYLKAKEKLWKFKYFSMQKYNPQNNPLKKIKNPSRYHKLYN